MGRHQLLTTVAVEEQMEAIALLSEAGTDLNGIICGGGLDLVRNALVAVRKAGLHVLLANRALEQMEEYRQFVKRETQAPDWYFEPTRTGPPSVQAYYDAAFGVAAPVPLTQGEIKRAFSAPADTPRI